MCSDEIEGSQNEDIDVGSIFTFALLFALSQGSIKNQVTIADIQRRPMRSTRLLVDRDSV
jgi:hypothetical protein